MVSMDKITLKQVIDAINKNNVEPSKVRAIVEELQAKIQQETAAAEEAPPKQKYQYVILVSDPEGRFPKTDFAGWVLQIPEDESPATVQERIANGAADYNATTKKGRLYPAKTVGEALENIPSKAWKESVQLAVKTRTPVIVLTTDNILPKYDEATHIDHRRREEEPVPAAAVA
jgi:hypothetical protein